MASFISPDSVDLLLDKANIIDVIGAYIKLKKEGSNYKACCPFHQEKTPSFVAFPQTQKFHCFGCQEHGNAINFIQKLLGLSFVDTVEKLASQFGIQLDKREKSTTKTTSKYKKLYRILDLATQEYQHQLALPTAAAAKQYLQNRGLTKQICDKFSVGYAPNNWNFIKSQLLAKQIDQQDLLDLGLLIENKDKKSIYDRFRNRIMFPIRNISGCCIGFGARCIGQDKIKYINSSTSEIFAKGKELYGLYESKQANTKLTKIIVVEGYTDVISLHQHGVEYAVATLGTAATCDHLEKAFKHTTEIIFCFDGDAAGNKAATRVVELALPFMEDGNQIKFVSLPAQEDPDSFIKKHGKHGFLSYIGLHERNIDQQLFAIIEQDLDITSLAGKAKLAKSMQPYLAKIPDGHFKQLIITELANRTGLSVNNINQTTSHLPNTPPIYNSNKTFLKHNNSFSPIRSINLKLDIKISLCGYIIKQLLFDVSLQKHINVPLNELILCSCKDSDLLVEVLKVLNSHPHLTPCGLLGYWHGTENGSKLLQISELDFSALGNESEFCDILARIKTDIIQQQQKNKWIGLKSDFNDLQYNKMNLADKNAYMKAFLDFKNLRVKK